MKLPYSPGDRHVNSDTLISSRGHLFGDDDKTATPLTRGGGSQE